MGTGRIAKLRAFLRADAGVTRVDYAGVLVLFVLVEHLAHQRQALAALAPLFAFLG